MVHGLETMRTLNERECEGSAPISAKSDQWAIVQVMGHQTVIGRMSEEIIAGTGFIRVDVPGEGDEFVFSKLIGGGAIHSIDIVIEEIARKLVKTRGVKAPLSAYEMDRLNLPAIATHDVERESSRTKATALAIIRERLAISSWERQRAVAEFPLIVAQVAHDMKRLMDELAYTEHTPKTVETLDYMESVIRDAYRSTFGRELGQ